MPVIDYSEHYKRWLQLLVNVCLCVLMGWATQCVAQTQWRMLEPGLEYTELHPDPNSHWRRAHAFRIDLRYYELALAFANEHQLKASSARHLAQENNALIAINGGFFTPNFKPLGLRIKNGKVTHHLKNTSWWGVFYTNGHHAKVLAQKSYRYRQDIDFAVQGGPRLIVNGYIPKLKNGNAERTALGITRDGRVIILVTQHLPLTTTELAQLMRVSEEQNGLACFNALNLDGGSSSQMYADIDTLKLHIVGFSAITDAVLVKKRKKKAST